MKKMILAFAATMMMTAAMAQDDNQQGRQERRRMDRTEMIKNRTDRTVKQYGLNEEQAKQLLELNTKYSDTMGPGQRGPRMGGGRGGMRGGFDRNRQGNGQGNGQRPELTEEQKQQMEAGRKKMEENMKQYDTELQKIMTPDQYKAYQADMEKRRNEGPRRGGPRN